MCTGLLLPRMLRGRAAGNGSHGRVRALICGKMAAVRLLGWSQVLVENGTFHVGVFFYAE